MSAALHLALFHYSASIALEIIKEQAVHALHLALFHSKRGHTMPYAGGGGGGGGTMPNAHKH